MNRIDKSGKSRLIHIEYVFNNNGPELKNILKESYIEHLKSLKR